MKKVSVIPGAVGKRETGRVAKEHSAPEAATFFKACACQVPLAEICLAWSCLVSPKVVLSVLSYSTLVNSTLLTLIAVKFQRSPTKVRGSWKSTVGFWSSKVFILICYLSFPQPGGCGCNYWQSSVDNRNLSQVSLPDLSNVDTFNRDTIKSNARF